MNAWQELGYELVDINANNILGVMNLQTTSANGTRQNTKNVLIQPIRCKCKSLTIKAEIIRDEIAIHRCIYRNPVP